LIVAFQYIKRAIEKGSADAMNYMSCLLLRVCMVDRPLMSLMFNWWEDHSKMRNKINQTKQGARDKAYLIKYPEMARDVVASSEWLQRAASSYDAQAVKCFSTGHILRWD
jgi:hypothetical protein